MFFVCTNKKHGYMVTVEKEKVIKNRSFLKMVFVESQVLLIRKIKSGFCTNVFHCFEQILAQSLTYILILEIHKIRIKKKIFNSDFNGEIWYYCTIFHIYKTLL